jgi:hypothetical protein
MDTQLIVLLGMVALPLIAFLIGVWGYVKATKSHRAKTKFGRGTVTSGEPLKTREYRRKRSKGHRDFLDDPKDAVEKADQLVHEIMRKRGYPITKIW